MNLLSTLTYSPLNNFSIRVDRIRSGWMQLYISTEEKAISYDASYLSDPLDDLLSAVVYLITKQPQYLDGHWVNCEGDYIYVFHELEPSLVTWLFEGNAETFTLVIWEEIPTEFALLVEEKFNSESFNIEIPDHIPNLAENLAFSIKDSTISLAKSLVKTFDELDILKKTEKINDDGDPEWGYNYSVSNLNILKEWVIQCDRGLEI